MSFFTLKIFISSTILQFSLKKLIKAQKISLKYRLRKATNNKITAFASCISFYCSFTHIQFLCILCKDLATVCPWIYKPFKNPKYNHTFLTAFEQKFAVEATYQEIPFVLLNQAKENWWEWITKRHVYIMEYGSSCEHACTWLCGTHKKECIQKVLYA